MVIILAQKHQDQAGGVRFSASLRAIKGQYAFQIFSVMVEGANHNGNQPLYYLMAIPFNRDQVGSYCKRDQKFVKVLESCTGVSKLPGKQPRLLADIIVILL